jgi:thiamine-phosphate pyrophosphorylase
MLVTDRRRLGAAGDDPIAHAARLAAAAQGGIDLIQVRERDLAAAALCTLVSRTVEGTAGTLTRVLVNDRLDVALAAGAAGVHLRGDSPATSRLRRLAPSGFLIGRSVHSPAEAEEASADGADFLVFGTVFASASKPGTAPAGIAALATAVAASAVPVLAIGGVTLERVAAVRDAGAAGIAAIGLFAPPAATDAAALAAAVEGVRRIYVR